MKSLQTSTATSFCTATSSTREGKQHSRPLLISSETASSTPKLPRQQCSPHLKPSVVLSVTASTTRMYQTIMLTLYTASYSAANGHGTGDGVLQTNRYPRRRPVCTASHMSFTTKAQREYHHLVLGESSNVKLRNLLGKYGVRLCQPFCETDTLTGSPYTPTPDICGGQSSDAMRRSLDTQLLSHLRSRSKPEHPKQQESGGSSLLEQDRSHHMKEGFNGHFMTYSKEDENNWTTMYTHIPPPYTLPPESHHPPHPLHHLPSLHTHKQAPLPCLLPAPACAVLPWVLHHASAPPPWPPRGSRAGQQASTQEPSSATAAPRPV